jgi:hypothetical protein
MPDIGWSVVVPWFWERKDDIWKMLKSVYGWFRSEADPDRGILITGPGGVGKTTLARILYGEFNWLLDEPWQYRESYGIEQVKLRDDDTVRIVVPPGQRVRREATWADLQANIARGEYRGVIVVSAFGYHTLDRPSYKDHPLYAGNKDDFLAAYTDHGRVDEAEILERLAPHLHTAPGKMWLLSVVTKEDLWFPSRAEVERHYSAGRYASAVASVVTAKGVQAFRHELVPACLVISNLVTRDGEPLEKNTEGYDHRRAVESVRRLFEVVSKLLDWEAGS